MNWDLGFDENDELEIIVNDEHQMNLQEIIESFIDDDFDDMNVNEVNEELLTKYEMLESQLKIYLQIIKQKISETQGYIAENLDDE